MECGWERGVVGGGLVSGWGGRGGPFVGCDGAFEEGSAKGVTEGEHGLERLGFVKDCIEVVYSGFTIWPVCLGGREWVSQSWR